MLLFLGISGVIQFMTMSYFVKSPFKLSIENDISSNLEIQIFNSSGLLLSTRYIRIEDLRDTVFGEDIPSGVYFVLVKQGKNRETLRIIKH